ncbi:hypothetical protein [Microvirga brassicacearum]|uniref:hypothetical protein n=1 Tax=Microvirga brassicacearum TaxID=2580413 RepID=UPI0019113621|nr:hypothetical protein [Microvirga brassicacearum]
MRDGQVLAASGNSVLRDNDPSAHARDPKCLQLLAGHLDHMRQAVIAMISAKAE